jgi:hypothetical protein
LNDSSSEWGTSKLVIFEYRDVTVPRTDYSFLTDIEDEPTWFQIFLEKGCKITPKWITCTPVKKEFLLYFRDAKIKRPFFGNRQNMNVDIMNPLIAEAHIDEASPVHSIIRFKVPDDVQEITAVENSLLLVTVTWKN